MKLLISRLARNDGKFLFAGKIVSLKRRLNGHRKDDYFCAKLYTRTYYPYSYYVQPDVLTHATLEFRAGFFSTSNKRRGAYMYTAYA